MTDNTPDAPAVSLLLCPFCGGEGEMSYYTRATSPEPAGRFVECMSCSACGQGFDIQGDMPDRDEYTKRQAIAAWNTRQTAALPSEDVERVARAIFVDQWLDDDAQPQLDWEDAADVEQESWRRSARAAIAAMPPEQIAGSAPFNAAIDAVAAAEGALCRARENVDAGDHASIDAELANLRRARGDILEARTNQEPR